MLDEVLQPGWQTVETGAGVSTILFALHATQHTCVVPANEEVERIRAFCADHEIPTDGLTFVIDSSEAALPTSS